MIAFKYIADDAVADRLALALTAAYYADEIAKRGLQPGASLYTFRGQPYVRARALRYVEPVKVAGAAGAVIPIDDKAAAFNGRVVNRVALDLSGSVAIAALPLKFRERLATTRAPFERADVETVQAPKVGALGGQR